MFRLVKTLDTGEPAWFLLCDHQSCMEARRGSAVVSNGDDYKLTRKTFLKTAIEEGWWVDLEGALCPAHAEVVRRATQEAQERARQAVAPARPEDILAFGRGRP